MKRSFLDENFFVVKETLILILWVIVVLIATFLLQRFGQYIVLKDLPLFGDVMFSDFKSTLVFCAEVAIILVYLVRPFYILLRWAMDKRR